MNTKSKRVSVPALLALAVAMLAGCSQGGGRGMGPVDNTAVDSFTGAVASIAGDASDDAAPVDIDAIAVVLVDDRPPVLVQ